MKLQIIWINVYLNLNHDVLMSYLKVNTIKVLYSLHSDLTAD